MDPNIGRSRFLLSRVSRSDLWEIYKRAFRIRSFEECAASAIKVGKINIPTYLSIGHEIPAATLAVVLPELGGIFAQHRSHSYYLAFGGSPKALAEELCGHDNGLAQGRRGSASISSEDIRMFGHSGLMGDQVPIAVGYSLSSRLKVLTVMGDASAEEDYVLGALGYAATKSARVIFICEDNNLSILTPVSARRSWSIVEVARALGVQAFDVADNPRFIAAALAKWRGSGPILLNIRVSRGVWHAGAGQDGEPAWDRLEMVRTRLTRMNERKVAEFEEECRAEMEMVWA